MLEKVTLIVLSGDVHYSGCMSDVLGPPGGAGSSSGPTSRVIQFTSSAAKNRWADAGTASVLRDMLNSVDAATPVRVYAVYVTPNARTIEWAKRKVDIVRGLLSQPDAGSRLEAILETITDGAPLFVSATDGMPSEPPQFVQQLTVLKDTSCERAMTFASSIGWLSGDDDELQMKMLEWDGRTMEKIDGADRPKLRQRVVKIGKR